MEKIVVLAAGLGRRMQRQDQAASLRADQAAVAQRGIKALIPIDRPFLDYVLTAVADAGFRRVCLVIGPDHYELRQHYSQQSGGRLRIEFAVQPEPLGTAHALLSAEAFAGPDPFAMINSDDCYPTSALRSLRELDGVGLVGFAGEALVRLGNVQAERLASFATLQTDDGGYLVRIVEKPDPDQASTFSERRLISMNCWRFGPAIFTACRRIDRSARNEYEIPHAVTYSMQQLGQRYRVVPSCEAVLSLSCRGDIASVTERLTTIEVRL
jgi:glucose-1-phosphate thymidylyltransferase